MPRMSEIDRIDDGIRTRHRPRKPSTVEGIASEIAADVAASDIAAHVAEADPHTGYRLESADIPVAEIEQIATDKVLGRSTAGTGDVELIACTAAGRALIDDATAAAQRTTLGLAALATLATVGTAQIDNDSVTYAKSQNVSATDKVLGRSTAGAGDIEEIACTAAGRALIDDASASDQRTTLSVPSTSETALGIAGVAASAQVAGVLDGVATTILATGTTKGLYLIYMTTSDAYSAWAVVHNTGSGSGCALLRTDTANANFVISVSGTNIQVTATGAGTRTIDYRYIRI